MPGLADDLAPYLGGAAFGTLTPQEQAVNPSKTGETLQAILARGYGGLVDTAKRAGQASETMRQGGDYDPAPAVNAALLTMGATPFGMEGGGARAALGSGPLSFSERMAQAKELAQVMRNRGQGTGNYGMTGKRTAPDAPAGSWDRLVAQMRSGFTADKQAILERYKDTVDPTRGALLAPGESYDAMLSELGRPLSYRSATLGAGVNDQRAGAAILADQGIRAYHGSPHDFDRFDISKVGTGEGAQAYGHGLYFAENPKVAQIYRDSLGKDAIQIGDKKLTFDVGTPEDIAAAHLHDAFSAQSSSPYAYATKSLRTAKQLATEPQAAKFDAAEKILGDWQEQGAKPVSAGKMYEVNIGAEPGDFLDWDRPLGEQPDNVRAIFQKLTGAPDPAQAAAKVRELEERMHALASDRDPVTNAMRGEAQWHQLARERDAAWNQWNAAQSGARAYEELVNASAVRRSPVWNDVAPNTNRRAAASELLQKSGTPGIRYLDQGSRYVVGGEHILTEQTPKGWQATIKVNRDNLGFSGPGTAFTKKTFATKEAADAWAKKEIQQRGTSNYVVFNPGLVSILRKYALPGAIGAGAAQTPLADGLRY